MLYYIVTLASIIFIPTITCIKLRNKFNKKNGDLQITEYVDLWSDLD